MTWNDKVMEDSGGVVIIIHFHSFREEESEGKEADWRQFYIITTYSLLPTLIHINS